MANKSDIGLSKEEIKDLLKKVGEHYGFYVETEVHTGLSKVDLVWFDARIKPVWLGGVKKLEKSLAIPVVGFEIEEKIDDRKAIRGDIASLDSLSPMLGVLVFSDKIKNFTLHRFVENGVRKKFKDSNDEEIQEAIQKKAERYWQTSLRTYKKFILANIGCRVVIFEEEMLLNLAKICKIL